MTEQHDGLAAEVVHDGVAALARSVSGAVDRSVDVASRARFIESVSQGKGSSSTPRRAWRALAIAASLVAAVSIGELVRRSRTSAPGQQPAPLLAAGTAVASRMFQSELVAADGSRITVFPLANMRVVTSDARGADLELTSGTLALDVRHRADTRWSVTSGVVRIQVTGTRFEAQTSADSVEVRLFEGALSVSIGDQRTLQMRSGQRLRVVGSRGEHAELDAIEPAVDDASSPVVSAEDASSASVEDVHAVEPSSAARPRRTDAPPVRWNLLALQGDFAAVLREARARSSELSSRSMDELSALAEAGRHEGDLAWTETAYEAIRDRHFARTGDRAEAVFACARTAEDAGDLGRAVEWYRRYENDFPEGRRGSEAIGRQFVIEQRRGRIARAQELARRYLIREGGGAYAARAHALLSD